MSACLLSPVAVHYNVDLICNFTLGCSCDKNHTFIFWSDVEKTGITNMSKTPSLCNQIETGDSLRASSTTQKLFERRQAFLTCRNSIQRASLDKWCIYFWYIFSHRYIFVYVININYVIGLCNFLITQNMILLIKFTLVNFLLSNALNG